MLLFFDTETHDLPKNWQAPASDTANWPRIVQLAWILCQPDGTPVQEHSHLVRPDGFCIAASASAVHGISTKHALENGEDLTTVLDTFQTHLAQATHCIAHNIDFDRTILTAEFLRLQRSQPFFGKQLTCTMKSSTDVCRIPGRRGYKWPTLGELHQTLFGEPLTGAHDALTDTSACRRCYLELRTRRLV